MTRRRGWNEGTIWQLKNGLWRAQVTIAGKRLSHRALTKAECSAWITQMQAADKPELESGGSRQMLADYLPEWMESHKISLRPKTTRQYEQIIRLYILPGIGKMRLRDLRLERLDRFYGELLAKGTGIRTIQMVHSVLHKALERAVRYDLISRNPAHGARVPRKPEVEMAVLDEDQVSRFLAEAYGSRHATLFYLAVVTGMRQAELFGLKWVDISWTKATMNIRRQAQRVTGMGVIYSEPKTRAGRRTIRLGENVLQQLRAQMERQQIDKLVAGSRWVENGLVFASPIGTPLDPSNVRMQFNKALDQAGLPHIRFHDLRHTAASLMLNHNVPVIVASKRLGHSKPSVTLDIYGHLYNEMQDEVARVMDDLVLPVKIEIPNLKELQTLKKVSV